MLDTLTIGRVTGVHGFRVKVELAQGSTSPSRAGLSGVQTAIAINSYVAFEIGAGEIAIGIITDLEARESYDPASGEELTLELVKPRRVASVQLLGTVKPKGKKEYFFDPGILVLPTLDTVAKAATPNILDAVFRDAPKRNRPYDRPGGENFDCPLDLGVPTASPENRLFGSFNDLFSRPLAIVGNTGSGKSYTVARLLQSAISEVGEVPHPRFFVLDINGEYGRAFSDDVAKGKQPDKIFLNGNEYTVPVWLMNAREVCEWLSAAEQTQEPVLKAYWSVAKGAVSAEAEGEPTYLDEALIRLEGLKGVLRDTTKPVNRKFQEEWKTICGFCMGMEFPSKKAIDDIVNDLPDPNVGNGMWAPVPRQDEIFRGIDSLAKELQGTLSDQINLMQESADKPLPFPLSSLKNPKALIDAIKGQEDEGRLRQNLSTLQLRLNNRLSDKRWGCLYNYGEIGVENLKGWLEPLGIGSDAGISVNIIDCSMLGHEVLPYVCGVIGRVLLELRERIGADERFKEPWVIVLEEAHNYVRPKQQGEDRGTTISRHAFERIAKEGRKFGMSLIVASQRPSEISQTIISQCANFIMHRLQNPNDIDHFKSIIPIQSRRLLDQISVLASGEAIIFGSAFHVPTRLQIHPPEKEPWSQTSAPFFEWQRDKSKGVDLDPILENWGLVEGQKEKG